MINLSNLVFAESLARGSHYAVCTQETRVPCGQSQDLWREGGLDALK